jgi:hypothetical protein
MLELADATARGAGEGTGLVAEDFAVHQRLGQAGAVDGHEAALPARAVFMQAARHQVLAGARFAVDHHVGRRAGQRAHQLAHALHRGRSSDQAGLDAGPAFQLAAQRLHLDRQLALVGRAPHDGDQMLGGAGLLDEVVGAPLHRAHRHGDVAVAGDEDDGQLGVEPAQFGLPVDATHAAQPHVAHDHGRHTGPHRLAGRFDGLVCLHAEAGELQGLRAAGAHVLVVLDEDDLDGMRLRLGHGCPPAVPVAPVVPVLPL